MIILNVILINLEKNWNNVSLLLSKSIPDILSRNIFAN